LRTAAAQELFSHLPLGPRQTDGTWVHRSMGSDWFGHGVDDPISSRNKTPKLAIKEMKNIEE